MFAISRSSVLKACVSVGLIFISAQVCAEEKTHGPGEHNARHTLNKGKKWETDDVLKRGMDDIRQTISASQEAIEKNQLQSRDYQQLAEAMDKSLVNIVKNCKLTKQTDAAFHTIVLADMSQSIELMRTSPKHEIQRAAALGTLQTLRNYGEYFQHPGWKLNGVKSH